MTSDPIRDPQADHLLTPANSALVIIDYQPLQVNSIASMDRQLLVNHILTLAKLGVGYGLPIVHSTVNVETGWNKPAIPPLRKVLEDYPTYDRTSINAWEDRQFREAVKETGRTKIILAGLWTEACLAFPALDMLQEGYEVYAVADAVGGTSPEAHEHALRRVQQAGAQMVTVNQLICEMQRDWNRGDTVELQIDLFIANGGTPAIQMMFDRDTAAPAAA
jgi:nicotinamidase-related amidase